MTTTTPGTGKNANAILEDLRPRPSNTAPATPRPLADLVVAVMAHNLTALVEELKRLGFTPPGGDRDRFIFIPEGGPGGGFNIRLLPHDPPIRVRAVAPMQFPPATPTAGVRIERGPIYAIEMHDRSDVGSGPWFMVKRCWPATDAADADADADEGGVIGLRRFIASLDYYMQEAISAGR